MKVWNQKQAELASAAEKKIDFADLSRMACLLCQRKFKSLKELRRHDDLSELHKVGRKSLLHLNTCSVSVLCAQ
jgi:hypothetical protein